jgi:hypothetical protein
VDPVKGFDVWFVALFVTIGVIAMLVGGARGYTANHPTGFRLVSWRLISFYGQIT